MATGWAEKSKRLDDMLRLRTRPVAIKFFEKAEDVDKVGRVRKMPGRLTTCQRITLARVAGFTTSQTVDDSPPFCSYIVGLREVPARAADGSLTAGVWCETQVDAAKRVAAFPIIPSKFEALIIAPLERERIEPDVILIYGLPAQIIEVICALNYRDYEAQNFLATGGSSCALSVARPYLTDKPSLALPDYGERRYGQAADDEVVLGLPARLFDKAVAGLEFLFKAGLPYPALPLGAQVDPYPYFPSSYQKFIDEEIEQHKKRRAK